MPLRYQALADYLAALPPELETVTLTFPQIEAILGESLPPAAGIVAWWRNSPTPGNMRVWRQAGWRAVQVHVRQTPATVTFVRADSSA